MFKKNPKCIFYDNENIKSITKLHKFVNETEMKMHNKAWKSAVDTVNHIIRTKVDCREVQKDCTNPHEYYRTKSEWG